MLLDPALLAALERLQLRTRRPLAGRLAGGHRSRRHGSSLDFADFREYQAGDDFRRIDYLTLARLDQLVVRLYEADDDLTIDLMVDTTASMGLDGKLRRAAELAAAVGFVGLVRRDAVRLHVWGSPPERFVGRGAFVRLDARLESLVAQGSASLVEATSRLLSGSRPPGLTLVCSDLLDPGWDAALRRLPSLGADVVVAHILGAGELEPVAAGDVDLVDVETGERVPVSLTPAALDAYAARLDAWRSDVASLVSGRGAVMLPVRSDGDVRDLLLDDLRRLEVM